MFCDMALITISRNSAVLCGWSWVFALSLRLDVMRSTCAVASMYQPAARLVAARVTGLVRPWSPARPSSRTPGWSFSLDDILRWPTRRVTASLAAASRWAVLVQQAHDVMQSTCGAAVSYAPLVELLQDLLIICSPVKCVVFNTFVHVSCVWVYWPI